MARQWMGRLARLGWVVLATTLAAGQAAAQGADSAPAPVLAPVPAADFFRPATMSHPVLSPSGKHLAVQVAGPGGRLRLAVMNVDPPRNAQLVAGFQDTDIADVQWVNDERLLFTVDDRDSAWDHRSGSGLFAVDRDGSNLRPLVERRWNVVSDVSGARVQLLRPNHHVQQLLRDGSADVVLRRTDFNTSYAEVVGSTLLRLDTRSGRTRFIDTGWTRDARGWITDMAGVPRLLYAVRDDQRETWWRPAADATWTMIDRHKLYLPGPSSPTAARMGHDGQLYATADKGDAAGTGALYRADPATGKLAAEPLVSVDGFDFEGQLLFDGRSRTLVGVRYHGDAWSTVWLNDDMRQVQARVDAKLPGLVNLLDVAECGCSRWLVVRSFSDRQPQVFWLYDREADRLDPVGQAQPQIDPRRMATRDFLRFKARDGMSIPLHVTRPNAAHGKGPWPVVVLVHGGPHLRGGDWSWRPDSQFLASRGYLVLEPEFRGSTGYGSQLFTAGMKQWGLKSQDDIADALRWAVERGEADSQRACIAGGSYGGYAALMGLIRDSALYRCGLAWMAVTDIGLMYDLQYSDLSDLWRQYGMPELIGDPVNDAKQLADTSPLQQAGRMTRPLLMAVGGVDRRVPPAHSARFRAALPDSYTGLTWLSYPDEGHGLLKPETRSHFWQQVERFLAQQLGPAATAR